MQTTFTDLFKLLEPHLTAPEDKTRDRIIMAAKARFIEEGFAKTTIGELCISLKVSKKTFYKFFTDKEDLVRAIVAKNFLTFLPKIQHILASLEPADIRLNMFMDFFLNTVAKNFSVAFFADMQVLIPELWEGIDNVRKFQIQNVLNIFNEGQKTGLFRADLDAEKVSRFMMIMITRVFDPKLLYENHLQLSDVGETLFSIVRDGIKNYPRENTLPDKKGSSK